MPTSRPEPSEYEPLRAHLAALPADQWNVELTFQEVERILGAPLPALAYESAAGWWTSNEGKSPQSNAWTSAGFGLGAVGHQSSSSGMVHFVRGMHRWPGTRVDSWAFGKLPVDERLRELALGYVQSAKLLSVHLGESPDEISWPRASVARYCYLHAVELFLKSCILHRQPAIEKCSHDISSLRKVYLRLYPDQEFRFETPYDISLDDLEDLLGDGAVVVEDFERKRDQVYRYLSDKQGRPPKARYMFSPASGVSMRERLESDINRVWARIREVDAADGRDSAPS